MQTDSLKSLGFLKKSLGMSRKAITKNQKDDGTTDAEVKAWQASIDKIIGYVETWEKKGAPAPAPQAPAPVPQPAASTYVMPPPVTSPVPDGDGSDDLLTIDGN